jgi:hypothetical protein
MAPPDLARDGRDARLGRQRVGGQRHGPAGGERAGREVGPHGLVEGHPVAAMDEDGEALRRLLGQEEVEPVARCGAVGEVETRPLP